MRGPPGTFLREWQGKGFGQGTPGLPPGPCAYATGRVDQAGARPGAGTASMSPNAPSTTSTPLLGTSPPAFSAQSPANVDIGAGSSGSQAAGAARPSVAGSMANALGAAGIPGGAGTGEDPQGVQSAFELLGRKPPTTQGQLGMETSDAIVKALTMAVSGERKFIPSWGGGASTLRAWLKQLSFWELDNHVPKNRWGVKLFQALPENSIPRRIAEGLPMEVITSERGYGAILTAILEKFKPYLEAAAPAAVDAFFFQGDRGRNETFSSFIAAKELARQEVENLSGERVPDKIAGRILLKQANLTESQRENMAIKHNALLSFEEVARAPRPLDRPDALLKPMASSSLLAQTSSDASAAFWMNEEEGPMNQPGPLLEEPEGEWEERHHDEYYAEEEFDEPTEPLLYFEADREFDEEEALYIWAYNDAYQQLSQELGAHDPSSFPAYQDVRRELQARRKGRQFFRPREQKGASKGKGRGKSPWSSKSSSKGRGKKGGAGKGKGRGNRGTAEELLARTRCYGCGELGHFSRDCPNGATNATEGRTSFVVSQGQGALNRTFMTAGSSGLPATVSVFAGVRTQAGQGLVDSAAEEGVIGSGAFSRLRALLEQQGLRPVAVRGPTGSCAGIGGSATVASVWDVPIGVARTNGLLRVTEVKDAEGFETPFLIPVSFQELVGMVIDYDKEEVRTRQGHATPMMRLPSGHRAVSVVEFNGSWRLPKELQQSGKDPFQLPKRMTHSAKQGPVRKHQGVTVWLRHPEGSMQEIGFLEGVRERMVVPADVLSAEAQATLEPTRVTYLDAPPGHRPYIINDIWQGDLGPRSLSEPWTGTVIFQQVATEAREPSATPSTTCPTTTTSPMCPLPTTSQAAARPSASVSSTEKVPGPVSYNISDTWDEASAVYDFEGVFSSVSGGEHVQQSVVLQPAGDHVQPAVSRCSPSKSSSEDAWQSVRKRSRDMFARIQASMKQEVPRRSVHFMTWARDRMKARSMFAGFVSLCLLSSSYASTGESAPVKNLDRVDTRQLPSRAPNEWADYHEQSLRSEGPMGTGSAAAANKESRSRGLPAGVHPIQNRARRRQSHETQEPPEIFAIFDDQDQSPNSFEEVDVEPTEF